MSTSTESSLQLLALHAEPLKALLKAYTNAGRCACALHIPQTHVPIFTAGWKPEWEEFTSILPHSPERFFAALSRLQWTDLAKRPFNKFESAGHIVHTLSPIYIDGVLICFFYAGYVFTTKPSLQEFASFAEERSYNIDKFFLKIKELPIVPETQLQQSAAETVSKMVALFTTDAKTSKQSKNAKDVAVSKPVPPQTKEHTSVEAGEKSVYTNVIRSLTRDIRTALNGNIGATGMLVKYMDKEVNEFVSTVLKSNDTLLSLLDNLHDYHDILTNTLVLNNSPLDVHILVEHVVDSLKKRAEESGLKLQTSISKDVPLHIVSEPKRFRQILRTAILTVMRYSISGTIVIALRNGKPRENKHELQCIIQNTTQTSDESSYLSTEADDASHQVYDSADLGMLVMRELVTKLGGRVKSNTDGNIYIGFSILSDTLKISDTFFDTTSSAILKQHSGVIIHNDPNAIHTLHLQCSYWGISTTAFGSAEEAYQWLLKSPMVDTVLIGSDLAMKDAFTEKLKSSQKLSGLPVVEYTPLEKTTSSEPVELIRDVQNKFWTELRHELEQALDVSAKSLTENKAITPVEGLADLYPCSIMAVEDEPMNRQLIERILRKFGYSPTIAKNGIEAVKAYSQKSFDLVYMDLQMPGMDGITAAKTILSDKVHNTVPKIIALSANASESDREIVFKTGMVDFLAKPLVLTKLQESIVKWAPINTQIAEKESVEANTLVDTDVILQTKELDQFSDESILDRLIEAFNKEAPVLISEVEDAFASNNTYRLSKATSGLMGMSRNLGLKEFAAISKKIDDSFGKTDLQEMTRLLKTLRESFNNTSRELKSYLSI